MIWRDYKKPIADYEYNITGRRYVNPSAGQEGQAVDNKI